MNPLAITAIRGNVKQKINVNVQPFTAFVGENRAGKTAHGDILKLCLQGKHPVGPHNKDLMRLSSDKAGLHAQIVFGDGSTRTFRVQPGVDPDGVVSTPGAASQVTKESWPLDLVETLTTGATKAREALIKRFGKRMLTTPPKTLTDRQRDLWIELMNVVRDENKDADAASLLALLSEKCRAEKLALGRTAKRLSDTAQSKRSSAESEAEGSDQIEVWRDMLVQAKRFEAEAGARAKHEADVAAYDMAQKQLKPWRERVEALERRRAELDEQKRRADEQTATAKAEVEALTVRIARIEWLIKECESNASRCPLCAAQVNMSGRAVEYRELLAIRKRSLSEAEARLSASVLSHNTVAQLAEVDAELATLREKVRDAEASTRPVRPNFVKFTGPTASELQAQIESALQKRASLETVQEIEREAAMTTERQSVAKVLEDLVTHQLKNELRTVVGEAERAVNPYLPEGFVARCDSETGLWAIDARGGPRGKGAWSGAEQTSLLLGLVLAWTEDTPVRVLYLDDAQLAPYSPRNIEKLCVQLQEQIEAGALTNVFLATTRGHELPPFVSQVHVGPRPDLSVLVTDV